MLIFCQVRNPADLFILAHIVRFVWDVGGYVFHTLHIDECERVKYFPLGSNLKLIELQISRCNSSNGFHSCTRLLGRPRSLVFTEE